MHRTRDEQVLCPDTQKFEHEDLPREELEILVVQYENCRLYTAAHVLVIIASTKETLPNRVVVHVPKREKSRKRGCVSVPS